MYLEYCIHVLIGLTELMKKHTLNPKALHAMHGMKSFFFVEPRSKMPMMLKNKCLAIVRFRLRV